MLWLIGTLAACVLLSAQDIAVKFVDVLSRTGITFVHDNAATPEKYFIETMGGGCAWIDYDNDGFLDVYFTQSAETPLYKPRKPLRSALYRSEGDGRNEGGEFARVNGEALRIPLFRDATVRPGVQYRYEVRAADRSGNESEPSEAATVVAE